MSVQGGTEWGRFNMVRARFYRGAVVQKGLTDFKPVPYHTQHFLLELYKFLI
jgi:hypothetical protein